MLDEADMLLSGGFQNKVIRLLNMLRFDEKLLSRSKESVSELPVELESEPSSHFTLDDKEDLQTDIISEGEENYEDVHVDDLAEEVEAGSSKRKDWRRVRKTYERSKQYVFVAATLPVNGKKTAGQSRLHYFSKSIREVSYSELPALIPGKPYNFNKRTYLQTNLDSPLSCN